MDTYPKYMLPSGGWTTDIEYADRVWARRGQLGPGDLELMARYRAVKAELTRLIFETSGRGPGHLSDECRQAAARVDALKAEGGEALPGDPECCQRYGRLHLPVFAVSGCRWYGLPS
jgi:hypothetical protein